MLRCAAVASTLLTCSALHALKLENAGVVALADTFDVGHAAVADLDLDTVEDLP